MNYSYILDKGTRKKMEDFVLIDDCFNLYDNRIFSLFSVIDGHGGVAFC